MKTLIICSVFVLMLVYGGSAALHGLKSQMDARTQTINTLIAEAK